MVHLWVRAEERPNEQRVGITPQGVAALRAQGFTITVEDSPTRALPIQTFKDAGAQIAQAGSWRQAPQEAIIFGLKELPEDSTPLTHRHIMFGHAYKSQPAGRRLLNRFRDGGGTLYDLEYLVDPQGRRVAAFGYWAGFVGAAVSLFTWLAQRNGTLCTPVDVWPSQARLLADLQEGFARAGHARPSVLIIGALGRVGTGAADLCTSMGISPTRWDMAETATGGPFPQILEHDVFLNCILARPGTPVFVAKSALTGPRILSVIGDISCDPDSDFSPIKVYDQATTWAEPARRVHSNPALDVTAIDNLPSLLPAESSEDFAKQLLPHLATLDALHEGVWSRAKAMFDHHLKGEDQQ